MLGKMAGRLFVALLATTAAGCFGRAGAYACIEDPDCDAGNGGRCEPTGFCSYLDTSCDSGRRYDMLASAGLDGTCVTLSSGSTAESGDSTGLDAGGGSTSVSATTASGATTGTEPCRDCIDVDGDGYGVGADCMGADCDDGNPGRNTGCMYVAPDGDDANTGDDPSAPWGTLAHAVASLGPGDSLVLLPGPYTLGTTGLLDARCGVDGSAVVGTMAAPISIRGGRDPSEERQAILQSDGSRPAIYLSECAHWKLSGLTAIGAELSGGEGSVVELRQALGISAHRLLVASPNGPARGHGVYVWGSPGALLEDLEVYDFHISGIYVRESSGTTVRRAYLNSRGRDDPRGIELPSYPTHTGDNGLRFALGNGYRVENSIFTDLAYGIYTETEVEILGSIALDVTSGFWINNGNVVLRDVVVVNSSNSGIDLRSTVQASVDGATVIGAEHNGVFMAQDSAFACDVELGCGATIRNVLSLRNKLYGIRGTSPIDWSVAASNAYGNTPNYPIIDDPIEDDAGRIQRSLSEPADGFGLELGKCVVFVPEDSPMHARGDDGADIGANILYRTVDGELTDVPLWHPETGAFPCGAIVRGINDLPGRSCIDVHELLNVRTHGCELPPATLSCEDPA